MAKIQNYYEDFSSWEDVQSNYQMSEEEPDDIYFADYTYENYTGDSTVIYRRGEKIYEVNGSHCSCYGLEGQWEPEEYTIDEFKRLANRVGSLRNKIVEEYL